MAPPIPRNGISEVSKLRIFFCALIRALARVGIWVFFKDDFLGPFFDNTMGFTAGADDDDPGGADDNPDCAETSCPDGLPGDDAADDDDVFPEISSSP